MNIREATINDLSQLLELEQRVIASERPYNPTIKPTDAIYYDLPKMIADDDTCLLVAQTVNEIVGTGYAQIRVSKLCFRHANHAYLGFMFVSPEYRGQGLNRKIVDRLLAFSNGRGVTDIYLDVYSQNEAAISAYQKAGFQPCLMEMKLSLQRS